MSLLQEALLYKQVHTATKVGLSWLTRSSKTKKPNNISKKKIIGYAKRKNGTYVSVNDDGSLGNDISENNRDTSLPVVETDSVIQKDLKELFTSKKNNSFGRKK
jgi:homogentisate 1,2-dioxygenase